MSTAARFQAQELEHIATNLLLRLDLPETNASITARTLVQAEMEARRRADWRSCRRTWR